MGSFSVIFSRGIRFGFAVAAADYHPCLRDVLTGWWACNMKPRPCILFLSKYSLNGYNSSLLSACQILPKYSSYLLKQFIFPHDCDEKYGSIFLKMLSKIELFVDDVVWLICNFVKCLRNFGRLCYRPLYSFHVIIIIIISPSRISPVIQESFHFNWLVMSELVYESTICGVIFHSYFLPRMEFKTSRRIKWPVIP